MARRSGSGVAGSTWTRRPTATRLLEMCATTGLVATPSSKRRMATFWLACVRTRLLYTSIGRQVTSSGSSARRPCQVNMRPLHCRSAIFFCWTFRPDQSVVGGTPFPFSRVIELDPNTSSIVWEFREAVPQYFFSPGQGNAQRLPNGNTLINEGRSEEHTSEL